MILTSVSLRLTYNHKTSWTTSSCICLTGYRHGASLAFVSLKSGTYLKIKPRILKTVITILLDFLFLGLFKRGYSYSGTALCPWALVRDGPQKTRQLASFLGCPTSDSRTIVKCLRRRPARKIVEQVKNFHVNKFIRLINTHPINSISNYFPCRF